MIGTYFFFILTVFILIVTAAVLNFTRDLKTSLKSPLEEALKKFEDQPIDDEAMFVYKNAWNEVQTEMKCCGINNVTDWMNVKTFATGLHKPEGCCMWEKNGTDISNNTSKIEACRKSKDSADSSRYYFDGCFTKIMKTIDANKNIILWVNLGLLGIMFVGLLFSFALCTMGHSHHTYSRLDENY